jgi:hypothetical protein
LQVKIRGRSSQCEVCGENATFTQQQFREFDYEKFTQSPLSPVVTFSLLASIFNCKFELEPKFIIAQNVDTLLTVFAVKFTLSLSLSLSHLTKEVIFET